MIFLPVVDNMRVLKRPEHMRFLHEGSGDIYYASKLDKYFQRARVHGMETFASFFEKLYYRGLPGNEFQDEFDEEIVL